MSPCCFLSASSLFGCLSNLNAAKICLESTISYHLLNHLPAIPALAWNQKCLLTSPSASSTALFQSLIGERPEGSLKNPSQIAPVSPLNQYLAGPCLRIQLDTEASPLGQLCPRPARRVLLLRQVGSGGVNAQTHTRLLQGRTMAGAHRWRLRSQFTSLNMPGLPFLRASTEASTTCLLFVELVLSFPQV